LAVQRYRTNDGIHLWSKREPGFWCKRKFAFAIFSEPDKFSVFQFALHAVEVTPPDLSLPANLLATTNTPYLLKTNLPLGQGILIEFAALTNRSYTVAYKDDLASTNWLAAQPSFKTSANYVLWIDYGPPETLSNSPARYYQIYLNP